MHVVADLTAQPDAGVGRALHRHRGGDDARLVTERCQPLTPVRDPDVHLLLVDQRGAVGLGVDDDGEVPGARVEQQRERPAVRVLVLAQLGGGGQAGELELAPRGPSERTGTVDVVLRHLCSLPSNAGREPLQRGLPVLVLGHQHQQADADDQQRDDGGATRPPAIIAITVTTRPPIMMRGAQGAQAGDTRRRRAAASCRRCAGRFERCQPLPLGPSESLVTLGLFVPVTRLLLLLCSGSIVVATQVTGGHRYCRTDRRHRHRRRRRRHRRHQPPPSSMASLRHGLAGGHLAGCLGGIHARP